MKELSIEEKARAYDGALERAKELMTKGYDVLMPELFPELKESEDECVEKIRKDIISYLNNRQITSISESGATEKWISWLEKQGEQKETLCDKCKKEQPPHSCQDITALGRCAVEHEQGPTDKTKPKFKAGDWIVFNGLTLYIKEVIQGYYRTISVGCTLTNSYDWDIDNIARLWTIQDAKDGDVLYSSDSNQPFIYKCRNDDEQATCYCGINKFGKFFIWNTKDCIITLDKYVPATKVQRDFLFQKMKEAGYEWDSEKKELNKIHVIDEGKAEMDYCFTKMMNGEKVSSAWSEEDECYMGECIGAIATKDGWSFEEKRKTKHWLKALKDRYTWKPSDEQLNTLKQAINAFPYETDYLELLYDDLKKLKE